MNTKKEVKDLNKIKTTNIETKNNVKNSNFITKEWLENNNIYKKAAEAETTKDDKNFTQALKNIIKKKRLYNLPLEKFVKKAIELHQLELADNVISSSLNKINCVKYAIYATESVSNVYAKKHDDGIAQELINKAKSWLRKPYNSHKISTFNYNKYYNLKNHSDSEGAVNYVVYSAADTIDIINGDRSPKNIATNAAAALIDFYYYNEEDIKNSEDNTINSLEYGISLYKTQIKENIQTYEISK